MEEKVLKEILARIESIEQKLKQGEMQKETGHRNTPKTRTGLGGGIQHLIDTGFLNEPRPLKEIHQTLKMNGWFCEETSLPSYLLPLIKPPAGPLTRIQENGKYRYVVRK